MRSLIEIAKLEEWRNAVGTSEVAAEHLRIAGGIASRGEAKTWVNTAISLGMSGAVTASDIEHVIAWYSEQGHVAHVEVCPYADASLITALVRSGFHIKRFENVFFRELARGERVELLRELPREIEIRSVDAEDGDRVCEIARVIAQGFARAGEAAREADVRVFEKCARDRLTKTYAAYSGEVCVGGGSVEVRGEIAALYGLAVDARFRGRGIQQALMAVRMNAACEAGANLVTIGGPPGMGTERTARRYGFQVAYTKAMMVKKYTSKKHT
ncbi:MAG TPA: GNAT family N-acetyltransferase [Phycisphaerales bacterium]|nr:GNAT family N-acetyltransferase [Phycisphaerales bacterium]